MRDLLAIFLHAIVTICRIARPGGVRSTDIIRAVIEMKQRNPTWGCPRIADQINLAFGTIMSPH
jgi:hypothetical protein